MRPRRTHDTEGFHMASRRFDALSTLGLQRVRIGGSFYPQNTDPPEIIAGKGWTVVRTGTGTYRVMFNDRYFGLEDITATLQLDQGYGFIVTRAAPVNPPDYIDFEVYSVGQPNSLGTKVTTSVDLLGARILNANATQNLIYSAGPPIAGVGGLMAVNTEPSLTIDGANQVPYVLWAATKVDEIVLTTYIPNTYNETNDLTLSLLSKTNGVTDTVNFVVQAYIDDSSTDIGGTTSAIGQNVLGDATLTISAGTYAGKLLSLTIKPTTHGTDAAKLYQVKLDAPVASTTPAVVDITGNVQNIIHWSAVLKNTGADF